MLASSTGTTVTAGALHTKGNWAEIEASCPIDADGFYVSINNIGARFRVFLDIGIGASTAETVLVPDIPFCADAGSQVHGQPYIPIHIPAGTRVSARCQASSASITPQVQLFFVAGEQWAAGSCRRATAYGHDASVTGSVCSPDPHNTAHTKGDYDELEDSTANPMKAWTFFLTTQSQNLGTGHAVVHDLAVGAAGSEAVILGDAWGIVGNANDHVDPPAFGPFWLPIPQGSRLAVRAQDSVASSNPYLYCYVLGFD